MLPRQERRRTNSLLAPAASTNIRSDDPLETTRQLLQKSTLAGRSTMAAGRGDTPYSASATPIQTAPSSPRLAPRAQTLSVPGITSSRRSPTGAINQTASKLVIVMVGLPARGKSYIVKKLARYFNWSAHTCRVFNCGDRRRQQATTEQDATFFDARNQETHTIREHVAMETLETLIHWIIHDNGTVGILDATNSTLARREKIMDTGS